MGRIRVWEFNQSQIEKNNLFKIDIPCCSLHIQPFEGFPYTCPLMQVQGSLECFRPFTQYMQFAQVYANLHKFVSFCLCDIWKPGTSMVFDSSTGSRIKPFWRQRAHCLWFSISLFRLLLIDPDLNILTANYNFPWPASCRVQTILFETMWYYSSHCEIITDNRCFSWCWRFDHVKAN